MPWSPTRRLPLESSFQSVFGRWGTVGSKKPQPVGTRRDQSGADMSPGTRKRSWFSSMDLAHCGFPVGSSFTTHDVEEAELGPVGASPDTAKPPSGVAIAFHVDRTRPLPSAIWLSHCTAPEASTFKAQMLPAVGDVNLSPATIPRHRRWRRRPQKRISLGELVQPTAGADRRRTARAPPHRKNPCCQLRRTTLGERDHGLQDYVGSPHVRANQRSIPAAHDSASRPAAGSTSRSPRRRCVVRRGGHRAEPVWAVPGDLRDHRTVPPTSRRATREAPLHHSRRRGRRHRPRH